MKITTSQIVRNLILVLLLIWVAVLSSGCLVNKPYARKTTTTTTLATNGQPATIVVEEVITKAITMAGGDAKQAVASLAAKSTKTTQSAGAEGIQQESTTGPLAEIMKSFFSFAYEMGKKQGGIPPIPGQ